MEQNYKSSVYERLSELNVTDEFSDVEFDLCHGVKKEKVKGHKLLFAIASPVFKAMMFGSLKEKHTIVVNGVEPHAFKTMKKFVYTNDIEFDSVNHAMEVYKTADKYDLPHLVKVAEEYITSKVTFENSLQILEFLNLHQSKDIDKACMDIIENRTDEIFNSDLFLECSDASVIKIVHNNQLITREVNLFNAVERWAKYKSKKLGIPKKTLSLTLSPIVSRIRFLTMTPEDFVDGPSKSNLLSVDEKVKLFQYIIKPGSSQISSRFSVLTSQRNPNAPQRFKRNLKVCWVKEDVLDCKLNVNYYSPEFYLNDMTWKAFVRPQTFDGLKFLSVYLICCDDGILHWSSTFTEFKFFYTLKAQNQGCTDVTNYCVVPKESDPKKRQEYGWSQFISWLDLTDPSKGFIIDDIIKMEVDISVVYDN